MIKEPDTFLHVGYGKCASSFLEKRYFIEENGFFNLYKLANWETYLDYQLLTSQSAFYSNVAPVIDRQSIRPGTMIGVSHNGFVGGIDYRLALERWKKIMPNARVLIVIRNQPEQIFSGYGQRVNSGYFRSIDEHVRELIYNAQQSSWGELFYDRVYEITKEYYEEVLMIPVERANEFELFISDLNKFFGIDRNLENVRVRGSLNHWTVSTMRLLNRVCRHGIGLPQMSVLPSYEGGNKRFVFNRVPGKEPGHTRRKVIHKISKSIGERLPKSDHPKLKFLKKYQPLFEDWFSESNQRLNHILDIDLQQYGYIGVNGKE